MSHPEQRTDPTSAESTAARPPGTGGDASLSADGESPSDRVDPTVTDRVDSDTTSSSSNGTAPVKYWRFAAMIATSMMAMFALTYANTYRFADVRWSETRFYMTFVMGAAMAVIMLVFMLGMYKNRLVNGAIIAGSVVVFALALWLVRSQTTVQDESYMRAMIPHHSIAILTSSRAEIDDVRVRELADGIIAAQKREIEEMNWLLEDISENGEATTPAEAEARPVPEFTAADYDD